MTTTLHRSLAGSALALLTLLTLAAQPVSATVVIDFEATGCETGGGFCGIPGPYGDTAQVDVSYASINNVTGVRTPGLYRYGTGYGDLQGVVFGGLNSRDYTSEIRLQTADGFELSLLDFDFASFANRSAMAPFTITDLAGNIISTGVRSTGGTTHSNYAVNSVFGSGVVIRWGPDGYEVGLDNIRYDVKPIVSAVPEPGSWALMITGFGLAGMGLRRRSAGAALTIA